MSPAISTAASNPKVQILKRPTTVLAQPTNQEQPKIPAKTLQQREQEYAQAWLRILGPEATTKTSSVQVVVERKHCAKHRFNKMQMKWICIWFYCWSSNKCKSGVDNRKLVTFSSFVHNQFLQFSNTNATGFALQYYCVSTLVNASAADDCSSVDGTDLPLMRCNTSLDS